MLVRGYGRLDFQSTNIKGRALGSLRDPGDVVNTRSAAIRFDGMWRS